MDKLIRCFGAARDEAQKRSIEIGVGRESKQRAPRCAADCEHCSVNSQIAIDEVITAHWATAAVILRKSLQTRTEYTKSVLLSSLSSTCHSPTPHCLRLICALTCCIIFKVWNLSLFAKCPLVTCFK